MEIERIKHRIHSIDGIPAFKAGEWPGSISSHWSEIGKRILVPKTYENILPSSNENQPQRFHRGKKQFDIQISQEPKYKPGLKLMTERYQTQDKTIVVKQLKRNFTEEKLYYTKRTFEPQYGYQVYPEPPCIVTSEKSNLETKKETSLEDLACRKKRISTISEMRNFYNKTSQGDKPYKNPEFSEDFFKGGGLIVGSTTNIQFNKTVGKKSNNFYETLNLETKSLDPSKVWDNKIKSEENQFQNKYVKNLNVWNNTVLKEFLPVEDDKLKTKGKFNNQQSKKLDTKKK